MKSNKDSEPHLPPAFDLGHTDFENGVARVLWDQCNSAYIGPLFFFFFLRAACGRK